MTQLILWEEIYLNNIIITIDGPAGSGKEKIAKYISKKYQLYQLDSGILYRRLSVILSKKNLTNNDNYKINILLNSLKILSHRRHSSLRNEKVGKQASIIATNKIIRNFINKQQRLIVKKILKKARGCVIDGRDIGSKVFKDAEIKLFVNVGVEIRAKRRHKQLIEQGEKSIYSRILKDMTLRDKQDKKRKISPLVIPSDAILIDNSKSFNKTCKQLNNIIKNKLKF